MPFKDSSDHILSYDNGLIIKTPKLKMYLSEKFSAEIWTSQFVQSNMKQFFSYLEQTTIQNERTWVLLRRKKVSSEIQAFFLCVGFII